MRIHDISRTVSLKRPVMPYKLSLDLSIRTNNMLELSSIGRYSILLFTTQDLISPTGSSATCLVRLCDSTIPQYPKGALRLLILYPPLKKRFEWAELPACVKRDAEMTTFVATEEVYNKYGVNPARGVVAVVRPDGYVGTMCAIEDSEGLTQYLDHCLVRI
jgi:phenol 2-monooxygenase